jgi:hypothetical protein
MSTVPYILSTQWVEACRKAGEFVNENRYSFKDSKTEKEYNVNIREALQRRGQSFIISRLKELKKYNNGGASSGSSSSRKRKHQMMDNSGGCMHDISVYVTPSVIPGPKIMKNIIERAGGKWLKKMPAAKDTTTTTTLVITCEKDVTGKHREEIKTIGIRML